MKTIGPFIIKILVNALNIAETPTPIIINFFVDVDFPQIKKIITTAKKENIKVNIGIYNIDVVKVPGAFEIPVIALKCAKSGKYNAVITLGAVIKGSTPHFDFVSAEVSNGVAQVSLQTGIPVIFGVLTTDNIEQAIERAGTKAGNKGSDAAKTAIEMANLVKLV